MELIKENIFLIRNEKIFSSNSYVIKNKVNQTCVLIDPGFDTIIIDEAITNLKLKPVAIIATHGHFDHVGSVTYFKNKFNIPFYLHKADLKICTSANFYLKMAHLNHKIETPIPDFLFEAEFEKLSLTDFDFAIYNFPGHSPGSCIVKFENNLFSGDILFKNGLGLGGIPKENKILLKESILKIFDFFHDNHLLLPGHGSSEYLGKIKNNNLVLNSFIFNTSSNA